jgi:hypothetical protein
MPPRKVYRSRQQQHLDRREELTAEIEESSRSIEAGAERNRLYQEAQRDRSPSVARPPTERFRGSRLHREIMATTEGMGDALQDILGDQERNPSAGPASGEVPQENIENAGNSDVPSLVPTPRGRSATASPSVHSRAASKSNSEIQALTKGEKAARTRRLNKEKAKQDAIDNAANDAARAPKGAGKKRRMRSDGAEEDLPEVSTKPKRPRTAADTGAAAAGSAKKNGGKATATPKTPKETPARGKKQQNKKVAATARNVPDAEADPNDDDDAEEVAPAQPKKQSKKKIAAEQLALLGPFSGKVFLLKGDDVEALIERSLCEPTDEMLRHRKMIWEMCERCAQYLRRGTLTHPFRVRSIWTCTNILYRQHLLWW